jgi:hypothetical protein
MKKINFNLESYNTEYYDVITRAGSPVIVAAVNPAMGESAIVGWVGGTGYSWSIDGKYSEGETNGLDLFLKEKSRKVYINITRQGSGEIRVYGTIDVKPRIYKGATLLKSIEVEV